MKYLHSVDCFVTKDGLVYKCDSYGVPITSEPIKLKDLEDEWWERLSTSDLSTLENGNSII
jgi:hypothetical protein